MNDFKLNKPSMDDIGSFAQSASTGQFAAWFD